MKIIDNSFRHLTALIALMVLGISVSMAQQQQISDELLMDNRERDDLNYEEMFNGDTEGQDIFSLIRDDENFSKFMELVDQSGLAPSMRAADEFTVFIPTNDAFKELTVRQYEALTKPENKDMLTRVIKAHIFPAKVGMNDFTGRQTMETSDGVEIPIETEGAVATAGGVNRMVVGGARIMKSDVQASNGVIHVVDRVIIPGQVTPTTGFGAVR
ncbi:fasciclin domain-containing protein [Anditalea andensis]|uniref:FAS1 domain-containing protein n=1 Tax=Anditalea andensis TaxID=1048983 RepID=A0A074LD99_9BACT|nr:fasciclin domain-containing protein [Anditalea andensis]KEO71762.1 hypothetical protein EL17_21490 [Anditalea andensis]